VVVYEHGGERLGLSITILACTRRVLDRIDDDLLRHLVNVVIDDVGITTRDDLRIPSTVCALPAPGKPVRIRCVSRVAPRTRREAAGLLERM